MIKIADLTEFKRGMLGILKMLMSEALEAQRLDHYSMYKTMVDITEAWEVPESREGDIEDLIEESEESIARMILNFPKDAMPSGSSYNKDTEH